MGFKNSKKNSLKRRICSVAMTLVLVLNLLVGYTPLYKMSYEDIKAAAKASAAPYRNVMYYGEWSIYAGQKNYTPDKIPGNYMTHLNFAFLDVDKDGNVISTDTWADFDNPNVGYSATSGDPWAGVAAAFIQLRNQYPNTKIGFSVGGWTRSGDFPAMAANATTRKNFAENIAKIVHLYGYDFVDIDWEYPTADRDPDPTGNGVNVDKGCKGSEADTKNFTYLMQDLRAALDKYGAMDGKYYELSCAMSASPAMMAKIEYDKVIETVDFVNMMTYDLCGAWAPYTGHQTALYTNPAYDSVNQLDCQFSVDKCIRYLYDTYGNSIDASKIVVGIAPYTRGWAGVQKDGRDANNPGLFATAEPNSVKAADGTTSGTFAYSDIGTLINQYGLKEYYDTTAEAAYYYSESTGYFFTCDNARSVQAKANYVKNATGYKNPFNKPLGGLISWMASLDAASEITKTSHDALYGAGTTLPSQTIEFPAMGNMNTTVTTSGADYVITIKNNNAITTPEKQGTFAAGAEANVLYYAEKFAGTATYPVYYIKTKNGAKLSGSAWAAGGTVGTSGDYTTVTMTAWPYYLGPGETATLTLTDPSGTANVSNIAEIAMTKRANASGKELAWTNLYGDASEAPSSEVTTTKKEEVTTKEQSGEQTTTKKEETTTASSSTGTGSYAAWASGVAYGLGDLVSYNGKVYECIYAHTSHGGWLPDNSPTLWKERPDLVNIETPSSGGGEQETDNNYTVNGILPQHMVTGYWHNFVNGSANLKLSDVPSYYDMICVAFTGNTTTPGEVTFEIDPELATALGGYTKAEFIQDIKDLKAKGQHVIISVGGAEGRIEINSTEAANRFASGLISIIKEYGFEGVDIDLEGNAVSGVDYIADALRTVHNEFGDNFIITMAPETYYIQADRLSSNDITTSYLRLALKIKDILTICYPQFYNSGGMNGYGGSIVNPGNADFLTSLSTLVIEAGLRPDQVAIGVPSMEKAASSGYVSTDIVKQALTSMVNGTSSGSFTPPRAYPTFRGVMTWSINWDATRDYAWAKAMAAAVDAMPEVEVETNPSEQPSEEETTTKVEGNYEGSNVALNKTVSVSGEEATDLVKANAVDGNTDTRWASDRVDNAWISVDLGAKYALSGIVLNWEAAYGKAYNIQVSADGNTWTTAKTLTNQDGGIDTFAMDGVEARYVKMQGVTRATEYGYSLYEFEVYGVEVEEEITTIDGGIEINGYQISTSVGGMRTLYSVDSQINGKDVVKSGLVYSLADYATESDVYVGSSNKYVYSYASTSAGVCDVDYSNSDIATSYAMTMKFAVGNAKEFGTTYRIRAYAQLSDGSYVYTDATTYTVYDIADVLYKGCKMNTSTAHNYLYTKILTVVNKDYEVVDYDWNNELVPLY